MALKPIDWSESMDRTIINERAAGRSWDHIGMLVGVARYTAIERGRLIGAKEPEKTDTYIDPERAPLSAGDVATWGAINEGTSLAGCSYPTALEFVASLRGVA